MSLQPISTTFDYMALDVETRNAVRQRTGEIKGLIRRTAQDIIAIGIKLIEVKRSLGHGNYGNWLAAEFDWSEKTARTFVRVANIFGSIKFTDLNISPSALYLLASPTTSEEARHKALQMAISGEVITNAKAKLIVAQHAIRNRSVFPADIEAEIQSAMKFIRSWNRNEQPCDCFICGKYKVVCELHHLISVRELAEVSIIQRINFEHVPLVWLCPNHHRLLHLLERLSRLPTDNKYNFVWYECMIREERDSFKKLFEVADAEKEKVYAYKAVVK